MKAHRDGGAETENSTTGNTMNTKPMINTIRSNITTALICGVLLGTTMFATAAGPKIASGSASFYEDGGTFAVGTYNLAFSAVQHADGTVTGQAQVSHRDGNDLGFISHVQIDCMHFLDDNTVILSGITVQDSDPNYLGSTAAFVVRDNGQGKGATPDEWSYVYYSPDLGEVVDCQLAAERFESGEYDLEAELSRTAETGNIQVKP
jgi:hypothetical protein